MTTSINYDNQIEQLIFPRNKVRIHGVEFDEDLLSELVVKHLSEQKSKFRPKLSDALEIYMRENTSSHRRKFRNVALHYYSLFTAQFGDMPLDHNHRWRN